VYVHSPFGERACKFSRPSGFLSAVMSEPKLGPACLIGARFLLLPHDFLGLLDVYVLPTKELNHVRTLEASVKDSGDS
jgi:hypothetical protein